MSIFIKEVNPLIDYSVRGLCVKEYPGHPKGCPNYNKKTGCPPKVQKYDVLYDISKPVYAIVNQFDFGEHVERMSKLHPGWSERQCECCLYWQPKARNQLLVGIRQFLRDHPEYIGNVEPCPEAMGIEITKTLIPVGIELEWPPKKFTYQVALAGIRRDYSGT